MAEGLSGAEANSLLAAMFQGTSYAIGALWVQLHVGAPGSAGTANVATNNTRADASGAFGTSPSGGSIVNDADVGTSAWSSPPASETYTHCSFWSASTSGTFLRSGVLSGESAVMGTPFVLGTGTVTADFPTAS